MTDPSIERLAPMISRERATELQELSNRILFDDRTRARFIEDPTSILREFGVEVDQIQLTVRDKSLLALIGDPRVHELYELGDIRGLQGYFRDQYGELVNPDMRATVAADFDVLVEAEAVAVAVVAVAAVAIGAIERPGEQVFQRLTDVESRLQTRVESLEARIARLEQG